MTLNIFTIISCPERVNSYPYWWCSADGNLNCYKYHSACSTHETFLLKNMKRYESPLWYWLVWVLCYVTWNLLLIICSNINYSIKSLWIISLWYYTDVFFGNKLFTRYNHVIFWLQIINTTFYYNSLLMNNTLKTSLQGFLETLYRNSQDYIEVL